PRRQRRGAMLAGGAAPQDDHVVVMARAHLYLRRLLVAYAPVEAPVLSTGLAERWFGVVVDAGTGELSAGAPVVDRAAGLGRQLRPSPPDDVVFERAAAVIVGDDAVLQRDAAAV